MQAFDTEAINGLPEIDIAWIAGFLEGEGCFFIAPTGSPGIKVLSTDRDVLVKYGAFVRRDVRGPYRDRRTLRNGNAPKARWEVNLYGRPAITLMKRLRPYMGTRRLAKIELVIATADGRALKLYVRHMKATCHKDRQRYHSSGLCHSCYNGVAKRRRLADREARGEIVENKAVAAAIGRKTAALWRQRLNAALKGE